MDRDDQLLEDATDVDTDIDTDIEIDDDDVVSEELIEELSIDGMCGVY